MKRATFFCSMYEYRTKKMLACNLIKEEHMNRTNQELEQNNQTAPQQGQANQAGMGKGRGLCGQGLRQGQGQGRGMGRNRCSRGRGRGTAGKGGLRG